MKKHNLRKSTKKHSLKKLHTDEYKEILKTRHAIIDLVSKTRQDPKFAKLTDRRLQKWAKLKTKKKEEAESLLMARLMLWIA